MFIANIFQGAVRRRRESAAAAPCLSKNDAKIKKAASASVADLAKEVPFQHLKARLLKVKEAEQAKTNPPLPTPREEPKSITHPEATSPESLTSRLLRVREIKDRQEATKRDVERKNLIENFSSKYGALHTILKSYGAHAMKKIGVDLEGLEEAITQIKSSSAPLESIKTKVDTVTSSLIESKKEILVWKDAALNQLKEEVKKNPAYQLYLSYAETVVEHDLSEGEIAILLTQMSRIDGQVTSLGCQLGREFIAAHCLLKDFRRCGL